MPTATATSLHPELWLDILPHVPYSPSVLTTFRLISHHFNALITRHETSLVKGFKRYSIPTSTAKLYPDLPLRTFRSLATLHARQERLQDIARAWPTIITSRNESPGQEGLHWLAGRYEPIFTAGLLLLYRLQDTPETTPFSSPDHAPDHVSNHNPTHTAQLALLHTLPSTSLATLLFVCLVSVKILRVLGPEPINERWCRRDVEVRSEVEMACEEALLESGVGLFVGLLGLGEEGGVARRKWALSLLRAEIARTTDRGPSDSDNQVREAVPQALILALRSALATKMECRIHQVVTRMWQILSGTVFDDLGKDEGMMGRLVNGEEIGKGMRRMGF
ncbi:hypothetical protein LTR29_006545 [Friedmanniomyces endolithicus]|nr:hypothetical protein LTR29_006545 [Friedmanniomyces endolithicus]